ncbi:sortase [Adlercreutzia sp. ZJ154]|uniref:sortase domain-containing protein n=1 Tax=Adlercreutzia sp. ZJ154 TaxID=2709790 RepID=UPI0013EBEC3F|nr:sortase [Adlercreutzia sp. ZJ154]
MSTDMSKYIQNSNQIYAVSAKLGRQNESRLILAIRKSKAKAAALVIAALTLSAALLAFPSLAYAQTDNGTSIQHPIAVEQNAKAQSPLDAGITLAINKACGIATEEGANLLNAQADMVSAKVKQTAQSVSTKTQKSATNTSAAPTSPPAQKTYNANTISAKGNTVPYIDTYLASAAPSSGAGLWMGSDSTTDGSWGYFIGHNPGPFHHVMNLTYNDAITVNDSTGNSRTYYVIDVFTVPNSAYWEDIQERVSGYGESVILQTCCGDNANYRIIVAR